MLVNLLMSLQIHNIRFRQVLLLTSTNKRRTFCYKGAFWSFYFFPEIMLESWGCGLYTSAAYTRVFTVW